MECVLLFQEKYAVKQCYQYSIALDQSQPVYKREIDDINSIHGEVCSKVTESVTSDTSDVSPN